MQKFLTIAAIGLTASVGLAQNQTNTDAASQADTLLREVIKTYATADALTDTVTITYEVPAQPNEQITATINMDRTSGNSSFNTEGMAITALDGQLYLESDDVKKKYFQTEITEDVPTTLQSIFGGGGLSFHFALTDGATVDDLTEALNVGAIENLAVTGFETKKNDDGAMRNVVTMTGANEGTLTLHINPKTNLITQSTTSFSPQFEMAGESMIITVKSSYDPNVLPKLPTAITFNPAGRKMVSNLMEFQPTPLGVGEVAPDFTLASSDGNDVKLSDLRGQVVVLDFWATWCGPCKMGLPLLEQFYTWTQDSEQQIKVFAVNVWERAPSVDDRKAVAMKYWEAQEFTMPTLFDLEGSIVSEYGVSGIPTTYIIAPDGTVSAVHVGFDQNMVEVLKKDASEAVAKNTTTG